MSTSVAVITGANAGIGLGFAEAIAAAGADVAIWGRREDRNEAAASQPGAATDASGGFIRSFRNSGISGPSSARTTRRSARREVTVRAVARAKSAGRAEPGGEGVA